jgi:hypothetical protein
MPKRKTHNQDQNLTTKARRHEDTKKTEGEQEMRRNRSANAESTCAHVAAERTIAGGVAAAQTLPHCPFCFSSCLRGEK